MFTIIMLYYIVEVTLAVSCEVAKVDVSLTPLAMMRKAEPRTHDLLIVKPENEDSRGDAGQEVSLAVIGEVA